MAHFLDKEYHPVIESYIADYVDETMNSVEKTAFEEVLVHDDDLRELAYSAKEGKKLLSKLQAVNAKDDFAERLLRTIQKQ